MACVVYYTYIICVRAKEPSLLLVQLEPDYIIYLFVLYYAIDIKSSIVNITVVSPDKT